MSPDGGRASKRGGEFPGVGVRGVRNWVVRSMNPVACLLMTSALAWTTAGCRGPLEQALPAGAQAQAIADARACDDGDMLACSNLATSYEIGDTVPVDLARAVALYQQACDGNAFLACTNLAGMLLEGSGVPAEPERAVRLLDRACTQQEHTACAVLGEAYAAGRGVPREVTSAATYLDKACDAYLHRGCVGLGHLTLSGELGEPDAHAALILFEKACRAGSAEGCTQQALILLEGPEALRQPRQADGLLERACVEDVPVACARLAELRRTGEGGITVDYDAAEYFRREACNLGVQSWCADPHRVALVRHAEAWRNVPDAVLPEGATPDTLTPLGEQVAQELAIAEAETLLGVITSPEGRARATAEILVGDRPPETMIVDPRLAPLADPPAVEGAAPSEPRGWAWREAELRAGRSGEPEGGETFAAGAERALAALLPTAEPQPMRWLLAVTHGDVLVAIGAAIEGISPAQALDRWLQRPGTLIRVEFVNGEWMRLGF